MQLLYLGPRAAFCTITYQSVWLTENWVSNSDSDMSLQHPSRQLLGSSHPWSIRYRRYFTLGVAAKNVWRCALLLCLGGKASKDACVLPWDITGFVRMDSIERVCVVVLRFMTPCSLVCGYASEGRTCIVSFKGIFHRKVVKTTSHFKMSTCKRSTDLVSVSLGRVNSTGTEGGPLTSCQKCLSYRTGSVVSFQCKVTIWQN